MIRRIAALAVIAAVIAGIVILIVSLTGVKNVKNLSISTEGTAQTLSWDGKDNYSYEIYRLIPDTNEYELIEEVPQGTTTARVEGSGEVTLNTYKVVSVKGKSKSRGKIVKAYTGPVAPTDVEAKPVSAYSVSVKWNATDAATGFRVDYSVNENMSEAASVSVTAADAKTAEGYAYTVDGLESSTTYYFQVQAFSDLTEQGVKDGQSLSGAEQTVSAKVWRLINMDGIDVNAPMICMTFDDGPDMGGAITERILDVFDEYGGYATFFQLGDRAEMHPDVMKRIADSGHEIGCHTYDHEHYGDEVTAKDITDADDSIEESCGERPTAFRSPGGETTDLIKQICASEDMPIYYWSVDSRDWDIRDADSVIYLVENYAYDGGIILLHNIYDSTAEAVETLVPWLLNEGYQLVTVSQMIQAKTGEPPLSGVQYYDYETWY